MVNVTELGDQEWRDNLSLRYGINTPDLPHSCFRYGALLSINHALDCKKVGLISTHYKKLSEGVADMYTKAFTPLHVRNNPLINIDIVMMGVQIQLDGSPLKTTNHSNKNMIATF